MCYNFDSGGNRSRFKGENSSQLNVYYYNGLRVFLTTLFRSKLSLFPPDLKRILFESHVPQRVIRRIIWNYGKIWIWCTEGVGDKKGKSSRHIDDEMKGGIGVVENDSDLM